MKFYVYLIKDVKVGCTTRLKARLSENKRRYGQDIEMEVLETCDDALSAGTRERYWADKLGFDRGFCYEFSAKRLGAVNTPAHNDAIRQARLGSTVPQEQRDRQAAVMRVNSLGKTRGPYQLKTYTCQCGYVGKGSGAGKHLKNCKRKPDGS